MNILKNHLTALNQLCREHHVEKMYLFGSALKDSFTETSDIDFLVRFQPIELDNYLIFKEDLKKLLGKKN